MIELPALNGTLAWVIAIIGVIVGIIAIILLLRNTNERPRHPMDRLYDELDQAAIAKSQRRQGTASDNGDSQTRNGAVGSADQTSSSDEPQP